MNTAPQAIPLVRPWLTPVDELRADLETIWRSGRITCGPYTAALEGAVSRRLDGRAVVGVSSCTSGLMLAARALGLRGKVVVPAFTFAATAHAMDWNGLEIVYCDVDPETGNVRAEDLKRALVPGVSAIVPVYIFGLPPEWNEIVALAGQRGIRILADAAQALGATYRDRPAGTFGDIEVFSLSPTKVVSAVEGGLVATADPDLAARVRSLRDYGKAKDGNDMDAVGLSARMSEVHALVAEKNLAHIEVLVAERARYDTLYREGLAGLPGLRFPHQPKHASSSHNYTVLFFAPDAPVDRETVYRALATAGIESKRYFYPALHQLRCYRERGPVPSHPVAERLAAGGLALPLWNGLGEAGVARVVTEVRRAIESPPHRG